jgi:hypothetical protein
MGISIPKNVLFILNKMKSTKKESSSIKTPEPMTSDNVVTEQKKESTTRADVNLYLSLMESINTQNIKESIGIIKESMISYFI